MEEYLLPDPLDELRVVWDLIVKLAHGCAKWRSRKGEFNQHDAANVL